MTLNRSTLSKQVQKIFATLFLSIIILQSCNLRLVDNKMKDQEIELVASQMSENSIDIGDSEPGLETIIFEKPEDSCWKSGAPVICSFLLGSVIFGGVFGGLWISSSNELLVCSSNENYYKREVISLNTTNVNLKKQLYFEDEIVSSSLFPLDSSAVINDLNSKLYNMDATVTLESDSNARLLQGGYASSFSSSLILDDLSKITSINIPGNNIYPYNSIAVSIANATNIAVSGIACTTTPSNSIPVLSALILALQQNDPAVIAATVSSMVTTTGIVSTGYVVGTIEAVLNAIKFTMPYAYSTDPGYIAGLAASFKSGATQAGVVAAINLANNGNKGIISSAVAIAVSSVQPGSASGISAASCTNGATLTDANYCVGGSIFTAATGNIVASCSSGVVNTKGNGCAADFTAASGTINTNAVQLNAINSVVGSSNVKALIAAKTVNIITDTGPCRGFVPTSSCILDAINNVAFLSIGKTYTWGAFGFNSNDPVHDYAPYNVPTIIYYMKSLLGSNSIAVQAAFSWLFIINDINDGLNIDLPFGLTGNLLIDSIIFSDPTFIEYIFIYNRFVDFGCISMNNAIMTALSKPPYSYYLPPTPLQAHKYGKMYEYFKFFPSLSEVSITGQTLQFPDFLNLTTLSNFANFSLNGCVIENKIVLPTDLSTLNISNSTLCLDGAILSGIAGANSTSPGFTNAIVNTAATLFNTQNGTSPLCAGNIGSIPKSGSFSTIESYASLYKNGLSELKAAKSMISNLMDTVSSTTVENQNLNNNFIGATTNLNNLKATLNTCINSFTSQVINLVGNSNAAYFTVANSCTATLI